MRPRTPVLGTTAARFALRVVRGREVGRLFAVDGANPSRVFIGTGRTCELRLADPHVSRRHAALDAQHSVLRVIDLHSRNGTMVDSILVAEAFLRGGEMLTVGETVLSVERAAGDSTVSLSLTTNFGRTRGASVEMRRLYPLCERLAGSDIPVVIEGETGTGKELLAESLHESSARAAGPFVVFDCAAVPRHLVEITLFGGEAGALYPGSAAIQGVFEAAQGGTLLIDEVGELDPAVQPLLLRAIDRGEIRRLGGASVRVDVRVLATTRQDLEREIVEGRLRDDLFYRLAAARIELPPLRERRGDVSFLAAHFWGALSGDTGAPPEALLRQLEAYAWPGNVRELEKAMERQVALGDLASSLPPVAHAAEAGGHNARDPVEEVIALDLPLAQARAQLVAEFERRYVAAAIERHGGNVGRAAAAAHVARRYFQLLRVRYAK